MLKKLLLITLCAFSASLQSMQQSISDDEALIEATSNPYQIRMDGIEVFIRMLIEKGASPVARDENGLTPLHLSTRAGNVKVIKVLLEKGCPVDIRTDDMLRSTALHTAIVNRYTDIINLLLKYGASPNAQDRLGLCPFHTAIVHRDLSTLKLLVEDGADLSISLTVGGNMSTLELASEATRDGVSPEIFTYVLEQGATDPRGYEGLARKIQKTRPQFAEQLRTYKPQQLHCAACKSSPQELKVCGTCKKVRYCTIACQKNDWASHKLVCKPAEGAKKPQEEIDDCSLCLDKLRKNVMAIDPCQHKIHSACYNMMVSNRSFNGQCPLCRRIIKDPAKDKDSK